MRIHVSGLQKRSIARGFLAGVAGGLAGSGAKILGELIFPPRQPGQEPPPALLARKIAGHPLSERQQKVATQAIHWSFGALTGGIYGALAERYPVVTKGKGTGFAVALLALTHESGVPFMGLDAAPWKQPIREHSSELATHCLYGFVTEVVRSRLVKKMRK